MNTSISSIVPQLRTTDLEGSINFYVNSLGFELDFRYEDFYAGLRVGESQMHLKLVDDPDPAINFVREGGHLHLFLPVADADAEAERLSKLGITPFHGPTSTPWGTREFHITDNQGHVLAYSQDIGGA